MLKSKLGIKNINKDKDTNSSNSVNNKDNNVHSKSSLKKLLNGKATGHNILNTIKPIKPKGSLYDLNNIDKNEEQVKNEDEIDNTTLASSSPKTLEPVDKDKLTKTSENNNNLNNLNDTQSSPNQHWNPSVSSSSSVKGLANTTFDSMKTLTSSSNVNSPKSASSSLKNLNTNNININTHNIANSPKIKPSKSSSPYLTPPKSPLEAFSKFSHFKSSENINSLSNHRNSANFLSVPNLNNKGSSSSLHSQVSSISGQSSESSLNKSISKKFSKKEKKESNAVTKDGKKPSSLFSSIGKYFKNKATNQIKDKDNKKSKEKIEVSIDSNSIIKNEEEEVVEITKREISTQLEEEKSNIKALNQSSIKLEIKDTKEVFDPESLKTPTPRYKEDEEDEKMDSKRISVEFTPKTKNKTIPASRILEKNNEILNMSSSFQSMTLVEHHPTMNKSECSSSSSTTTQPIPINPSESLKVMDESIRITSSPLSESGIKENILNSETEDCTEVRDVDIDKEGTYRQSYYKVDDASSLDNEDTIIKKSSVISTNNNRLSVRDINFCRELRMTGDLENNRNSLTFESTITENKAKANEEKKDMESTESSNNLSVKNSENDQLKVPTSPLANDLYTTIRPETQIEKQEKIHQDNLIKKESQDLSKQSSFEVRYESQYSFDDSSMMEESSIIESDHNILASSPRLSIASPYSHSNYSSTAHKSPNQENKRFNLFIPKAPSAIGLITTPSNSTHNTSMSGLNQGSASLDAIPMALMEEPIEEKRCPYCQCIIVNNSNYHHFEPMDSMSFDEDKNSINSSSRFSSVSKLTMSPKLSPRSIAVDKLDNTSKTNSNTHHYGQFLSSGGPGSVASSVSSSKDYSHSINSSYTFSTVTTTSEEDCDCHCHDARYQHPSFHVYHTKQNGQELGSQSVSGLSFSSYQSRYSNLSGYTAESMSKIYDKRSFCSASSSFSLANSLFFNSGNKNKTKNIRRKDFSKSTREIGRGATCVVKLVHKINDPTMLFALKEYKLSRVKSIDERTFLKHLRNEYQIGSLLHHPNVIETFAFLMTKTHNHKRRKYFVVLEYCEGGDLFNTIQTGHLGRQEINCNFKQLMDGVNYLHSLGVAHCDIKPENILIKNVSQLKIIDFGTSEIFKYPYTPDTIKKSRGVKGSKPYIAPEQFQKSEYDPRASDIWSCAIVYIASLFDELPWRVASLEDFDFLRWKKERRNDLIRHIPDGPRQLITQMLNPDPEKRITMEQIYENEWFSSIKTCISGEVQCHDKKHLHIQPNESSN